jgi:hypothetical protein
MRRSAWGLATCLAAGCAPASVVSQYSGYSGCPKDKIDVAEVERRPHAYRASGCGNGATFFCDPDTDQCGSPQIVVAHRHAKQFSCSLWDTKVEDLGGDLYLARGCNHPTTYQCFRDSVHVVRCVLEATEARETRRSGGP